MHPGNWTVVGLGAPTHEEEEEEEEEEGKLLGPSWLEPGSLLENMELQCVFSE